MEKVFCVSSTGDPLAGSCLRGVCITQERAIKFAQDVMKQVDNRKGWHKDDEDTWKFRDGPQLVYIRSYPIIE